MTSDYNNTQLEPCPLNHHVSAGLKAYKSGNDPRIVCLDCGLTLAATDWITVYERWHSRSRAAVAAPHAAWLPIDAAPKSDTTWLAVGKIADAEPNRGSVLWWYRAMFWRGRWRTSRDYSGSIEPTHFLNPEEFTAPSPVSPSLKVEEVAAGEQKVVWTSEPPKIDGVYWWRLSENDPDPDICETDLQYGTVYDIGEPQGDEIAGRGGEWLGPIVPTAPVVQPVINRMPRFQLHATTLIPPPDAVRKAAAEIVQRVYGGDKDEFGELEAIVAAIISRHLTATVGEGDEDRCAWTLDDSNDGEFWETGCGEAFRFTDGGPTDNGFVCCYKCGKRISVGRYSDFTSVGEEGK